MSAPLRVPATVQSLGEALRFLREARKMSLRALAKEVGVSAPFLSDLERNRRSTDRLDAFATALNVELDELRRFDPRLSPEMKEWMANPDVHALLREMKDSGMNAYQLSNVFHDVGRRRSKRSTRRG